MLTGSARSPERRPDGLIQAGPQLGKVSGKKTQMDKKKKKRHNNTSQSHKCHIFHSSPRRSDGWGGGEGGQIGGGELRRTGLKNERVDGGRRGQGVGHKL